MSEYSSNNLEITITFPGTSSTIYFIGFGRRGEETEIYLSQVKCNELDYNSNSALQVLISNHYPLHHLNIESKEVTVYNYVYCITQYYLLECIARYPAKPVKGWMNVLVGSTVI